METQQDQPDVDELADAFAEDLLATRAEIARLRDLERELVEKIHETAPARKFKTSVGLVEISKRRNRSWDHEEIVRHLTRIALDRREIDPETGEIKTRPTWEIVTDALISCAGISYWRIGELKGYGLDPDEYYEITSEARSVRFY